MPRMQDDLSTRLAKAYALALRGVSHLTPFFSAAMRQAITSKPPKGIQVIWSGGYPNADRQMAYIGESEPYFDYVILACDENLTHPSVLGACLHAGMDRKFLGDILFWQGKTYLVVKASLVEFVKQNVVRISGKTIHWYETSIPEDACLKSKIESYVIASLRLDAVVASLAHCSRSKATSLIAAGLVKVNDEVRIESKTSLCHNDFVSIRKVGRFQVLGDARQTKKGRLVVDIKQML